MLLTRPPFIAAWLALLSLLLCSCPDSHRGAPPPTQRDAATATAIEGRLISELAPTDTRAGRQRNAIINRAIDGNYDVYAAPEGYFYEVVDPGEMVGFAEGDYVAAHYTGRFLDGRVFDSSRRRGQKLRFFIGALIPAWNLGLQRLQNGGSIRILTPSSLAYGEAGLAAPDGDTLVPANTVLEFLIEEVEAVEPPDGM